MTRECEHGWIVIRGGGEGRSFRGRAVYTACEREVRVECQLFSVGKRWVCGWEY
jgi:hypothetical protein